MPKPGQKAITNRQKHCLVAMLNIEAEDDRMFPHRHAGAIAWRLGFTTGPRQHGNGAKDGRSFSGHGATGKWVTSSLLGLEKRGLITRRWNTLRDSRMKENRLTESGRKVAEHLVENGWTERDPDGDWQRKQEKRWAKGDFTPITFEHRPDDSEPITITIEDEEA